MTALTLLNKHFNNLDTEFGRPFFSPAWFKDFEGSESYNKVGFSSQTTYNEKTSSWDLTLEVAGVTKNDLKLDVKEGLLSVSGEKTKGLNTGKFERYFKLPEGIDAEKIEAEFEDGVLTVHLPLESKKASKTIAIK